MKLCTTILDSLNVLSQTLQRAAILSLVSASQFLKSGSVNQSFEE